MIFIIKNIKNIHDAMLRTLLNVTVVSSRLGNLCDFGQQRFGIISENFVNSFIVF